MSFGRVVMGLTLALECDRLNVGTTRIYPEYKMQYVEQKSDWDCVIACLAMVTNQTYEEVLREFRGYCEYFGDERGVVSDGIGDRAFYDYLTEHGYVYAVVGEEYLVSLEKRIQWPAEPFAPIHVVGVDSDGVPHSVVMTWNGVVYDPEDMAKIGLWEYEKVGEIVGIWPRPKR